jgi:glycosyltransferase involved in cell wall biosynthesis
MFSYQGCRVDAVKLKFLPQLNAVTAVQVAQNYLKQDQLFHLVMHLPCVLASVSSAVQDILQQEFGRSSLLIPNGIDCERFTPGPWQPAAAIKAAAGGTTDASAAAAADCGEVEAAAAPTAAGTAEVAGSGEAAGTAVALMQDPAAAAAGVPAGDNEELPGQQQQSTQQTDAACAALEQGQQQQRQQQQLDGVGAAELRQALSPAEQQQQQNQQPAAAGLPDSEDAAVTDAADAVQPVAAAADADAAGLDACSSISSSKKRILIVGNPALPLKGFPAAIAALAAVSAMLPISVRWVCQVPPTAATVPNLPLVDFELETVVSPSQAELPALYRGNDVFMFSSRYEAWGMLALEAIAVPCQHSPLHCHAHTHTCNYYSSLCHCYLLHDSYTRLQV